MADAVRLAPEPDQNQIKQWKDLLLDGVADVFDDKPGSKVPEVDATSLHAKIGQLTLENDFLD